MLLYKNFEDLKNSLYYARGEFAIEFKFTVFDYVTDALEKLAEEKNYTKKNSKFGDDDLEALFKNDGDKEEEWKERWYNWRAEQAKWAERLIIEALAKDLEKYISTFLAFIKRSGQKPEDYLGFSLDISDMNDFCRQTAEEVRRSYHANKQDF